VGVVIDGRLYNDGLSVGDVSITRTSGSIICRLNNDVTILKYSHRFAIIVPIIDTLNNCIREQTSRQLLADEIEKWKTIDL
jgi:hypothetical protein